MMGVVLSTVHGAKGLEWFIVFSALADRRQISCRSGRTRLVPKREMFDPARYEGSTQRKFAIVLCRANSRTIASLSSHSRVTTNAVKPSPYSRGSQTHSKRRSAYRRTTPRDRYSRSGDHL